MSLLSSVAILALLFWWSGAGAQLSPGRLRDVLAGVPTQAYLVFAALHLLGTALRALRFQLLLRSGGERDAPGFPHMLLVTGVRNMVVDLLPARLGELAYVALLNRGYRVRMETCLSSLAVSAWLDILVLLPLLVTLMAIIGAQYEAHALVMAAALVVAAAALAGYLVLFHGIPWLGNAARRAPGTQRGRMAGRVREWFASLATALRHTRDWRVLGLGLLLSAGVRIGKYAGLLVLFLAIAQSAQNSLSGAEPVPVLVALVASEASASLPIPTFMSFGTYEAGGTAAFSAFGFPAAEAASVVFTMHLASQILDYGLGLLCLALIFLLAAKRPARIRT